MIYCTRATQKSAFVEKITFFFPGSAGRASFPPMAQTKKQTEIQDMTDEQFQEHLEMIDRAVPVYMDIYEKAQEFNTGDELALFNYYREKPATIRNLNKNENEHSGAPHRLIWVRDPFSLVQAAQIIEGGVNDFAEYAGTDRVVYGSRVLSIIHERRCEEGADPWDRYEHEVRWGQYEALYFLNLECYPTPENIEELEKQEIYRPVLKICGAHTITRDGTILACPTVSITRDENGRLHSQGGAPSLYGLRFHQDQVIHPYITQEGDTRDLGDGSAIPYSLHTMSKSKQAGELSAEEAKSLPLITLSTPVGDTGATVNLTLSEFNICESEKIDGALDIKFTGKDLPRDLPGVTLEFMEVVLGRPLWGIDADSSVTLTVHPGQIQKPQAADVLQVMQGVEV